MLPHEGSIGVIGLVGPFLGLDKAALDDLPYHHFKGLAVALVQGQQEAQQHGTGLWQAVIFVAHRVGAEQSGDLPA